MGLNLMNVVYYNHQQISPTKRPIRQFNHYQKISLLRILEELLLMNQLQKWLHLSKKQLHMHVIIKRKMSLLNLVTGMVHSSEEISTSMPMILTESPLPTPSKPNYSEKSRLEELDAGNEYFIRNLRDTALNGSGFVVFHYVNPAHNNSVEKKLGFVKAVDNTWWLGSGIYGENVTLPKEVLSHTTC